MSEYSKSFMSRCEVHNQITLQLIHVQIYGPTIHIRVSTLYRNEIISLIGIRPLEMRV